MQRLAAVVALLCVVCSGVALGVSTCVAFGPVYPSVERSVAMGRANKTRKFAEVKRLINPKELKSQDGKNKKKKGEEVRQVNKTPSALFFKYNSALGPPYRVLIDTNFINFSIKSKLDLMQGMVDCLYAKCIPCICDAVMAELEKLGDKYRVALRIAKDKRFERIPNPPGCQESTYADDVIVEIVRQHRCYIVATCDRDLKRRIRKIPGVPIMFVHNHRYSVERLPEATVGGAPRF